MHGIIEDRYAKALFEEAVAQKKEEKIKADMDFYAELFRTNPAMFGFFIDPEIGAAEKKTFVDEVSGKRTDMLTKKFLYVLIDQRREKYLEGIDSSYDRLLLEYKGFSEAEIRTAFPLAENQREKLKSVIEKYSEKNLIYNFIVDESIIGGIAVKIGDRLIDDTVLSKLGALRERMTV